MFRSPRARRALVAAASSVVALSACNPLNVPLFGETGAPGCVNGNAMGPIEYVGPNGAHLDIIVTSPDDPALSSRTLQVALLYPGTPGSAANAVPMGSGSFTGYVDLASGQLVDVAVCSGSGGIGGYRYDVELRTRARHSDEFVGELRGTR